MIAAISHSLRRSREQNPRSNSRTPARRDENPGGLIGLGALVLMGIGGYVVYKHFRATPAIGGDPLKPMYGTKDGLNWSVMAMSDGLKWTVARGNVLEPDAIIEQGVTATYPEARAQIDETIAAYQ